MTVNADDIVKRVGEFLLVGTGTISDKCLVNINEIRSIEIDHTDDDEYSIIFNFKNRSSGKQYVYFFDREEVEISFNLIIKILQEHGRTI